MTTQPTSPTSADSESLRLARRYLGRSVDLTIDRPYGSHHSVHGFTYYANYGFVPGTLAPDGDELDVVPTGAAPPGDDAIAAAVEFQEIPGRYRVIRQ